MSGESRHIPIRPRRRDRYGEVIDDEPVIHGARPPAIDLEEVVARRRAHFRDFVRSLSPVDRKALELELADRRRTI